MGTHTSTNTRASVLTLRATGSTTNQVADLIGLSERQVQCIYSRAVQRGFDPVKRPITIEDTYVEDAPRSGRPKKQTDDLRDLVQLKELWLRGIKEHGMAHFASIRVQEDQADEEAWIDEEDA